jgi:DNA-binding NarL/FixJ family response regulator
MRALVIDDHPLIQEIVPVVLAKALGEVAVATESTLEAGLARAGGADAPDLVLLDLGLPGCEGLEALARFRSKFPDLPVVVLSGTCDRDSILAALAAGAAGYIPKTSKPDVMIAALKVVAAGGTYVPSEALDEPAEKPAPRRRRAVALDLTQRQ